MLWLADSIVCHGVWSTIGPDDSSPATAEPWWWVRLFMGSQSEGTCIRRVREVSVQRDPSGSFKRHAFSFPFSCRRKRRSELIVPKSEHERTRRIESAGCSCELAWLYRRSFSSKIVVLELRRMQSSISFLLRKVGRQLRQVVKWLSQLKRRTKIVE